MKQHKPLILASSSPRRKELLASLGLTFDIMKPDIDEAQAPDEPPFVYVQRLSQEKAQATHQLLRQTHPANMSYVVAQKIVHILAADTVVILAADTIGVMLDAVQGRILGKPANADEARAMLQALRNRDHLVCTAFTLQVNGEQRHTEIVQTTVTMRDYTDAEIEAYIATGDPFDKAGSYAIQHEGFHPVARVRGSHTNVVGLPIDEVKQALITLGVTDA